MQNNKGSSIKNNLFIIILWLAFAFVLWVLLQNTDLLQASILSVWDYNTIKKNKWDIGYKTENNRIEVFCADAINPLPQSITTTLVFDGNDILWNKWEYQWSINIKNDISWEATITLTNIKAIDCKESLIDTPFVWDTDTIIVDSVLLDQKWTKIGNLNKKEKHWK